MRCLALLAALMVGTLGVQAQVIERQTEQSISRTLFGETTSTEADTAIVLFDELKADVPLGGLPQGSVRLLIGAKLGPAGVNKIAAYKITVIEKKAGKFDPKTGRVIEGTSIIVSVDKNGVVQIKSNALPYTVGDEIKIVINAFDAAGNGIPLAGNEKNFLVPKTSSPVVPKDKDK